MGGKVESPPSECRRIQNRIHGFHHVSNNKLPQSNTARILIKTNNVTSPDIKAMVYEIYTLEFSFEVRWFHGTWSILVSHIPNIKVGMHMAHERSWSTARLDYEEIATAVLLGCLDNLYNT